MKLPLGSVHMGSAGSGSVSWFKIHFLPHRSVSLGNGNVVLADPMRIWTDLDQRLDPADPLT
jgi:hypothetical protein